MAKQTLNNLESKGIFRSKLNSMFSELYLFAVNAVQRVNGKVPIDDLPTVIGTSDDLTNTGTEAEPVIQLKVGAVTETKLHSSVLAKLGTVTAAAFKSLMIAALDDIEVRNKITSFTGVGGGGGTNVVPTAPTGGTVNDVLNTFTFTLSSGYAATDHEYSLNGGVSWANCTSNVINVGDTPIDPEELWVRVKAAAGRDAGAVLKNVQAFTGSETAGGAYTVERTFKINFSNEYGPAVAGWNNMRPTAAQVTTDGGAGFTATVVANEGPTSPLTLTIPFKFTGATVSMPPTIADGAQPTNLGVFPDYVAKSAFAHNSTTFDGGVQLSGFNPFKYYQFHILGNGSTANLNVRWSIGAQSVDKLISHPTTNGIGNVGTMPNNLADPALAHIWNVQADANGNILFRHKKLAGGFETGLNAIVIEESNIAKAV